VISGWIIWIASQNSILEKNKNSPLATMIAVLIWLVTLILGMKSIGTVFGWF
jgi:Mn2+/Fe2+ NRAMP family transporter